MTITRISDADASGLEDYRGLTDVALRSRTEEGRGLYIAESRFVIERAVEAGHEPRSFLCSEKWVESIAPFAALWPGVPVFVGSDAVLEEVTGFHVHRGALAAMRRPEPRAVADVIAGARRVAVLEDLVNHTNVGAVFRSAAAMGVDAVLVSPRCADPLYRRSVRVSMGSVFQVPWARVAEWPGGLAELRDAGFVVAALALEDAAVPLDAFARDLPERLALMLGTEGDGLTRGAIAGADLAVRIPMAHGIDSLNVAAASAVAFWATR